MSDNFKLPRKICLSEYSGDYHSYIDAVYEIFEIDFIRNKALFGSHILKLKYNPIFQNRAYTFYHMTHKGETESERDPDLRRCECMPWAKPTIENVGKWNLKFWRQTRQRSKDRVCICLENPNDVDYFVIIEVRDSYILLWTAFVAEHRHETMKKLREYSAWVENACPNINLTPDQLIANIQNEIKARSDTNAAPVTPSTHG